uniref:Thymidylate synthase n=1 Tax=Strigamia maritima TaxID=126957 RepID=T1IL89_STRMM
MATNNAYQDLNTENKKCTSTEDNLPKRSLHCEYKYLDQLQEILDHGSVREDRTKTGTLSLFGMQARYNLRNNEFPLLTTKRVFWRGVVEELLWFIKGSTDTKELNSKGVNIWNGNSSREFLDQVGLNSNPEGDVGPVYGFQWRHFGAKYKGANADYTQQGFDQLEHVIDLIRNNPFDRGIIMSSWNPSDLSKMALRPCHVLAQFYVSEGELSCQLYQRSADMGLGVPFNIASYSLLTCILAHVTNLKPGDFIHSLGDAHVYLNHVDAIKEQLSRTPRSFPKLFIDRVFNNIDEFVAADIRLVGYKPHPVIKMDMAV